MPRSDSAPVIEIQGLKIQRDRTRILKGIDWKVMPDENWVILGPNGCGKTSLLSAMTAYLTPSAGVIRVCGMEYGEDDWQELRRRVGIVSSAIRQKIGDMDTALETVVSGRYAMINYWGRVKDADRKKARSLLKLVELGKLQDRLWAVLSQGERQRVLIARALMAEPSVLILDEPCAGLDPVAREAFLGFLARLAKSRNAPTLILVTHHVEEIVPGFGKALLLKEGKVLAAGVLRDTVNPRMLSQLFRTRLRVGKKKGRYYLEISARPRVFLPGKVA